MPRRPADTHESAPVAVAPLGATKRCNVCGQTKPLTTEHYSPAWYRNAQGERHRRGWESRCKPCNLLRMKASLDKSTARKKAGVPDTPMVRALNRVAPVDLPKASAPSLRAILEAEAAANYEKLAKKLVRTALAEGKDSAGALKLVFSYILGTPREASEDHGPTEFWHALLAGARQLHAGVDADLEPADPDLEHAAGPD